MQTAIREKQGLQPIVDMVRENPDSPAIMLNGLGALCELCRRCSMIFFLIFLYFDIYFNFVSGANKKIVKEAGLYDWLGALETHDNTIISKQAKELRSIVN